MFSSNRSTGAGAFGNCPRSWPAAWRAERSIFGRLFPFGDAHGHIDRKIAQRGFLVAGIHILRRLPHGPDHRVQAHLGTGAGSPAVWIMVCIMVWFVACTSRGSVFSNAGVMQFFYSIAPTGP